MAVDADAAHRKLKESSDPVLREAALETAPVKTMPHSPKRSPTLVMRSPKHRADRGIRMGLVIRTMVVVSLAGLVGWLGFRAHQSHWAEQQRQLLLKVGGQGALNLTTASHTEAEPDVQRILDTATRTLCDDSKKRSPAFSEVVKQAQSNSQGTVTRPAGGPTTVIKLKCWSP
jgi:Mce-associated membrane protein